MQLGKASKCMLILWRQRARFPPFQLCRQGLIGLLCVTRLGSSSSSMCGGKRICARRSLRPEMHCQGVGAVRGTAVAGIRRPLSVAEGSSHHTLSPPDECCTHVACGPFHQQLTCPAVVALAACELQMSCQQRQGSPAHSGGPKCIMRLSVGCRHGHSNPWCNHHPLLPSHKSA
jgi:hypothetical protein